MTTATVLVVLWLLIGVVVASRSIPWRDVSMHARFARMHATAEGAPQSPWADRVFFALAVLLWPVSCRWGKAFAQRPGDLTAAGDSGSVGGHGDGYRQPPLSDPHEPRIGAP